MIEIPLTRGKIAIVDDCDAHLAKFKWFAKKGWRTFYAARTTEAGGRKRNVRLHRAILGAPDGMDVDHINGDGLDNRRENLRLASRPQNQANAKPRANNTSGYRGVFQHGAGGRWQAKIWVNRVGHYLGTFQSAEEAARAYDEAALLYFGEFARLNLPRAEAA